MARIDRYDGFAKPLFHFPKPRRHGAQSGRAPRIARAEFGARESGGRNISWLQSLEIPRNGIGIGGRDEGGGLAVVCAGRRPALSRAYCADRDRRARRRREASPKPLVVG